MRRIASALLGVASLLATATPAFALYKPQPCGNDPHVQCAVYDPNEVYQITTVAGRATLVVLEPGEKIVDNGFGMGDGKAWTASINPKGILIKPKETKPDTNLMIVTNVRNYTFSLVTAKDDKVPTTWVLSFDYPDSRERAVDDDDKKRSADRAAIKALKVSGPTAPEKNTAYFMRGDTDLAPTAAWDDGRFTYFEYATTRMLPAGIYRRLPDGSEATVEFNMDGDTMVVHETGTLFRLRTGNSVLDIRNDGYNPDRPYNAAGTTVPGTVRVLKEGGERVKQ
ncbi:TrbG/VirB9 family P-type conjugative transfer protein [Paraburkholderia largidicola]|uniref:P-type conjugative transfer protein VirB9 n=1 Tax=Paraburkholderia largidicola TaxID=3014751 RepID=A0A7I8C2X8_9BURK|nr:TrbG/VirB9 family P-type conjugative transfer protein [Paraburkholderia sp. PGU16]BCF95417.1 P-type conjugative transfer protein VirB9 [Paraburkholderia sp. PGU16]